MTAPDQSRRRALLAILDQYPMEREAYLNDGRRMVAPRDEFAEKIETLFAEDETSLFRDVMQASANYVGRFGGSLSSQGAHGKMAEEYAEYQVAIARYEESAHEDAPLSLRLKSPHQLRKEVAGELIDLLVTIGGYAASVGLEWGEIEQAARDTLDKLGSRTTQDYAWYPSIKQVAKKSKMGEGS